MEELFGVVAVILTIVIGFVLARRNGPGRDSDAAGFGAGAGFDGGDGEDGD